MSWYPYKAVAAGRHLRGLTQEDLARRLEDETRERWTRGMVAQLEVGRKHFTVDILLAVSRVLDLPVDFFLYEPSRFVRANPGYRKLVDGGHTRGLEIPAADALGHAPLRRLLDRFGAVTEDGDHLRSPRTRVHHLAA